MKFRTTAKEIRNNGGKVVSAGYCDLQNLLHDVDPVAYTCGVYGWNFDVYTVHGITITTGYRGMVGRTANNIREYEKRAEAIVNRRCNREAGETFDTWYDKRRKDLADLLKEFCEQA